MYIRNIHETDYTPIISVIDSWWGGRQMADMLPRLFFTHFQKTSFVVELDGKVVAFLIGFVSQTHLTDAYIHFSGVHPDHRKQGLGEKLYDCFFESVKARGCDTVRCVTSPVNSGSIAFHTRLGFQPEEGDFVVGGIPVKLAYDGEGQDRVLFVKKI